MILIVRQADVKMIAVILDNDLVVVSVLFCQPQRCVNSGRLEIDEEQKAKREPPGEPAGDSRLEWLWFTHARRRLVNLPYSVKCGMIGARIIARST